jgi:hypothetical protein
MGDDEKRKQLEAAAQLADAVGAEHHGHSGCATTAVMGQISRSIRQSLSTSAGPAQVATAAYRQNWDVLFGGKQQPVGQA